MSKVTKLVTAQGALRGAGMKIKKTEFGEYRVAPIVAEFMDTVTRSAKGLNTAKQCREWEEANAYYTNDLDDAVMTGLRMAESLFAIHS